MLRGRTEFDKDVAGDIDITGNVTLNSGGEINTTSNGNIVLRPDNTGITIIGDAGSTSHSLAANDDLLVTGKLEVDGSIFLDGVVYLQGNTTTFSSGSLFVGNGKYVQHTGQRGDSLARRFIGELVTVPVGQGSGGVISSSNLAPASSIVVAIAVRITTAPGGGATTLDIGRTNGGNLDEFIDGMSTASGTTASSIANNDGNLTFNAMMNASADTFTLTTDGNVTGSDMVVYIAVWYDLLSAAII